MSGVHFRQIKVPATCGTGGKVEELKTWVQATLPAGKGLEAVLKLCAKALAYQYPLVHRTSNMLD